MNDEDVIKRIIDNLPDNNIFYRKEGLHIESSVEEKKIALFPFMKKENKMKHKGEKNRWLWLANFTQRNNLNLLKVLTKVD